MPVKPKAKTESEIPILEISQGQVTFAVVGTQPLIFNRMSEKAKRSLLLGGGRKNDAEKAANLKHDPVAEYRDSVYRMPTPTAKTRLAAKGSWFKGAMETAALDMPGTKRTEIGRLSWVNGDRIELYGVPKLLMSVVRSADMNKTPDIRTRAIIPQWACFVTINFVRPKLNERSIARLMAAAGITAGVGDWRQEKGSGNYGQFHLADAKDAQLEEIVATGGREAQEEALRNYACYDDETEELLEWYSAEVIRLGKSSQLRQDDNGSEKEEQEAA